MTTAEQIEFHLAHKTPLVRLANSVRWFEDMASHAAKADARLFISKALDMRRVVTGVFVSRHLAGAYDEAAA